MKLRAEHMIVGTTCVGVLLSGCGGEQSVLEPKGDGAHSISLLAQVLFISGAAVLMIVVVALLLALRGPERLRAKLSGERAIVAGGIAFPSIVLTALLTYGFLTMRPTDPGLAPVRIAVEGKQWWWRVRYDLEQLSVETANEIRIPVGTPVEFALTSADVMHSFWVPNLAGKIDMTPGRTTRLTVVAREPGIMRGQCAEFCGGPHGLMSLRVIAMLPDAFQEWMSRNRSRNSSSAGHQLFLSAGCGGCHSVTGTNADGRIGPDLTDVGSRAMLAAETLPNTAENVARWIASGKSIKPENAMPEFKNLTADELTMLATYLTSLK